MKPSRWSPYRASPVPTGALPQPSHSVDVRLAPPAAFPVKPVPGEPGTYGRLSQPSRFVDAGLAPHDAFPVEPVPGEPGTYGPAAATLALRGCGACPA